MEELTGIMSHAPASSVGTESSSSSGAGPPPGDGKHAAAAAADAEASGGGEAGEGGRLTGERLPEEWDARFDLFLDTVRTR